MYLGIDAATQVEPTRLKKVALAKRVGAFLTHDHTEKEMAAVTELARVLARDIEISVRTTLAFEVRESKVLPKDLALRIANDVEDVATPFLKSTPVLDDLDLAQLIPGLKEYARAAIAKRDGLGVQTIDSLITHGESPSVSILARNQKAKMNEAQMGSLYSRFQGSSMVMESLAVRADLPMALVKRMVDHVATAARETLVERYGVDAKVAATTSQKAGRSALFTKLKQGSLDQVRAFVNDLKGQNRLGDAIIIDGARAGASAFVESAIALKAGLTVGQAKDILAEGAPNKVIPLLRDAGIKRENMAELIRELANCYA